MERFTDDYLLYLLAQSSAKASSAFHATLAAEGISVATWRILASLYPDAPSSLGELAQSCMAKQPTMTRQVDRLEAQGLVTRTPVPGGDRRRVTVQLTADGTALAARLVAMAKAHEAALLERAGSGTVEDLKRVLRALVADA